MGFFNKLSKADLPESQDIIEIPKKLKEQSDNSKLNDITVRFFNQDFSKVIESIGKISHKTSIPIIYFDKPEKLAVIMFDDTSYIDVTRNNKLCIDVCESYPYAIDKNISIFRDDKIKYFNEKYKKSYKELEEIYKKSERKLYIPILLNNIPIPIIEIEKNYKTSMINGEWITHKKTITMNLIRQLSDIKLLERVGKKDNSALMFCALLFLLIGILTGFIMAIWVIG